MDEIGNIQQVPDLSGDGQSSTRRQQAPFPDPTAADAGRRVRTDAKASARESAPPKPSPQLPEATAKGEIQASGPDGEYRGIDIWV